MPKCRTFPRLAVAEAVVPPRKNLHADLMGVPVSQAHPDLSERSVSVSVRGPVPRVGPLSSLLQEGLRAREPEPPMDDRKRCPPLFSWGGHCEAAMTPTRAGVSPARGHGAPRSPPCCGWREPRIL